MKPSTMKRTRVLLADDHALMRSGMKALLDTFDFVEVTAEACNGREALERIGSSAPDIVLMDIAMEGLNGLEAARRVAKNFPGVKVIILSMHANEEYVFQAWRAGVAGYLLKDAAVDELRGALEAVSRGETYLSRAISRRVGTPGDLERMHHKAPLEELTPRQREVFQLIAEGQSTKEIAFLLQLSAKTVETHRMQLMDRLGIHDVPGLIRYAIRVGLVEP